MDQLTDAMTAVETQISAVRSQLDELERTRVVFDAQLRGLLAQRDALTQAGAGPDPRSAETSAGDDLRAVTKDVAIVRVLEASSEPMRIQGIVDALHAAGRPGEQYNGISVYLDTLLKQHRVRRVSRGLYTAGS